jgi:hypothetical protein
MPYYERLRQGYLRSAQRLQSAERTARVAHLASLTSAEVLQERVVFGTPERVAQRLPTLQQALGLAGIIVEANVGGWHTFGTRGVRYAPLCPRRCSSPSRRGLKKGAGARVLWTQTESVGVPSRAVSDLMYGISPSCLSRGWHRTSTTRAALRSFIQKVLVWCTCNTSPGRGTWPH